MSHNLYDNQHDHQNNANPYAYHEAAGEVADDLSDDLSDEASLAYLLYTARIKDTCRGLALAMVFPSMLTSFLVIAPLARAIDNGVSLSGFFRYAIFVVFPFGGIPCLITICVTVGIFFGKRWAVDVGMIVSCLPTLAALAVGLMVMALIAFVPFCFCAMYTFEFFRVKLAISQNRPIDEKELEYTPNKSDGTY